jgi:hypothetical protein
MGGAFDAARTRTSVSDGFFERRFVAFTFAGSLGVIGVVIWMMMH